MQDNVNTSKDYCWRISTMDSIKNGKAGMLQATCFLHYLDLHLYIMRVWQNSRVVGEFQLMTNWSMLSSDWQQAAAWFLFTSTSQLSSFLTRYKSVAPVLRIFSIMRCHWLVKIQSVYQIQGLFLLELCKTRVKRQRNVILLTFVEIVHIPV